MRIISRTIGVLVWFLVLGSILPAGLYAQNPPDRPVQGEAPRLRAVITAPEDSPIGRPILLDASASRVTGADVRYVWHVSQSSEPISRTIDAIFTPEREGLLRFRLVLRSTIGGNAQESQAVHEVMVYKRKIVLIADPSVPQDKIDSHIQSASGAGIYMKVLRLPQAARAREDAFTKFVSDQSIILRGANVIVLWTDAITSLQSFMQGIRFNPSRLNEMRGQTIVVVTDRNLSMAQQMAYAPFSVLQPKQMILVHREAVNPLLSTENVDDFLNEAQQRDIDMQVLRDAPFPFVTWRLLSLLVDFMLVNGISSETILLLLMLPVIATILSFLKQVIGMTTFGLFAPSIIALSFVALGWWVGLLFFLFIIFAGYVSRAVVYRLHILYVPKMAIIITLVSLSLLLLLALTASLDIVLSRDTVFVLLIMSTLAESFLTAKSEQGFFSASSGIVQTIIAALLCVLVVQWSYLQALIIAYPELLLLTIGINVLIGRYTGLRLSEYFRFRALFKHLAGTEE